MSDLSASTGVIDGRRSLDIQMMEGMEFGAKGDFGCNTIETFEPFIDLGFRSGSGDGDTGSGFETGGGVRLCTDNFKLEARFHVTAQNAADEYSETGFSLVASVNPESHGSGLILSVSPPWGTGDATFSGSGNAKVPKDNSRRESLRLDRVPEVLRSAWSGILIDKPEPSPLGRISS